MRPRAESPSAYREARLRATVDACTAVTVMGLAAVLTVDGGAIGVSVPRGWEYLVVLSAMGVLLSPRFPFLAVVITAAIDAAAHVLPMTAIGCHIGLLLSLQHLTMRYSIRVSLTLFALTAASEVATGLWTGSDPTTIALYLLSLMAAVTSGRAIRGSLIASERSRQRAQQAEMTADAVARRRLADDRLRTARELHDAVAQQIAVMNLAAGMASTQLRDQPDAADQALHTMREAGRGVMEAISELVIGLRRDPEPLPPAYDVTDLADLVAELGTLFPDLRATLDLGDRVGGASSGVATPVAYTVVREAMINAYKHGDHDAPVHLAVTLGDDGWRIEVLNRVRRSVEASREGFGLTGVRERVEALAGRVEAEHDGAMFRLRVEVPFVSDDPLPDRTPAVVGAP